MKLYLEEDLLAAIEAVVNGAGQREASSECPILRTILRNRLRGAQSQTAAAEPQMMCQCCAPGGPWFINFHVFRSQVDSIEIVLIKDCIRNLEYVKIIVISVCKLV